MYKYLLIIISVLLTTACSDGGGENSNTSIDPVNIDFFSEWNYSEKTTGYTNQNDGSPCDEIEITGLYYFRSKNGDLSTIGFTERTGNTDLLNTCQAFGSQNQRYLTNPLGSLTDYPMIMNEDQFLDGIQKKLFISELAEIIDFSENKVVFKITTETYPQLPTKTQTFTLTR